MRLNFFKETEDLTLVIISYKIYETNLCQVSQISYEITMSEKFHMK